MIGRVTRGRWTDRRGRRRRGRVVLPGHAAPIAAVLFDLDRTLIGRRTASLGRVAAFLQEQIGGEGAARDHGHAPSLAARLLARPYDAVRRRVTLPPAACAVLDAL